MNTASTLGSVVVEAAAHAGPSTSAAGGLLYRQLQPSDFLAVKAAHAALFPIDYEDNFFTKATNGIDRIWSCAAFSTDACGAQQLVGFITAKTVFLHQVDASDRHHMGLLSPVTDHDRVLYILTLGVMEGHRQRGIASTLVDAACRHAYDSRCRAVFLHVITYNAAALALYSRRGFACVARLAAFYHIATGRTPDPRQQVYDAYLYVRYVGPPVVLASPWDMVALAWSPLRCALGSIPACVPTFCRAPQQQVYGAVQSSAAHPADTSSPHRLGYGNTQHQVQQQQQQQLEPPQLMEQQQQSCSQQGAGVQQQQQQQQVMHQQQPQPQAWLPAQCQHRPHRHYQHYLAKQQLLQQQQQQAAYGCDQPPHPLAGGQQHWQKQQEAWQGPEPMQWQQPDVQQQQQQPWQRQDRQQQQQQPWQPHSAAAVQSQQSQQPPTSMLKWMFNGSSRGCGPGIHRRLQTQLPHNQHYQQQQQQQAGAPHEPALYHSQRAGLQQRQLQQVHELHGGV